MRARLIGNDVDLCTHGEQRREHLRGVAEESDRERCACIPRGVGELERFGDRAGQDVEVAVLDATREPRRVDVDADGDTVVHGHRKWLGAAHSADPAGEGNGSREGAPERCRSDGSKGFVGALEYSLRANVDPGSRGHLAVHCEPEPLEASKLVPVGPISHEVGVGEQYARRPLVGLHDSHRFPRLHEHSFVIFEGVECANQSVVAMPVARSFARSAVNHEVVGVLGNLGVKVVLKHAQHCFLLPTEGVQRRATVGANRS